MYWALCSVAGHAPRPSGLVLGIELIRIEGAGRSLYSFLDFGERR